MAKCMGISSISFKSSIVSNDRRNPMDKARDAAEQRKIVRQEMRRRDLENKIKKGESLTAAEKAELAAIYIATAAEELSKYDPRISLSEEGGGGR